MGKANGKHLTKRELVLTYGDTALSSFEIARRVGCSAAYVRVVWQREAGVTRKDAAAARACRRTGDKKAARLAAAKARKEADRLGITGKDRLLMAKRAYARALYATCDREAVRRAWRND